jgi:acetylornithine/N-succinyldiaminopimelate aminotransferase
MGWVKEAVEMESLREPGWGSNREVADLTDRYIMRTYGRFPIAPVRGQGCRLWDADGKVYLDFVAGLAVCNLGHCHPRVVRAIQEQAATLLHVSNLYHIPWQSELARTIVEHSFGDRVFFCNSGAEANETAIKLVRRYEHDIRRGDRSVILTMENSFHGRTLTTLSATGQEKVQKGFEPLVPGFRHVPFDDRGALLEAIDAKTCAILVEPIQGEGGVICPAEDYLSFLRSVCDERGLLLVFDEVQVGIGRTGTLFAHEASGVAPDIMTLAKGLGGGVAIGAAVASEAVAAAFTPGSHASTFGGNPLATAAARATLEVILEEGVLENCRKSGRHLRQGLEGIALRHPRRVKEVRGRGLIQGMELTIPGRPIVEACMQEGLLINCTADTVLRFLPPLIVTTQEVDAMLEILDRALSGTTTAVEGKP